MDNFFPYEVVSSALQFFVLSFIRTLFIVFEQHYIHIPKNAQCEQTAAIRFAYNTSPFFFFLTSERPHQFDVSIHVCINKIKAPRRLWKYNNISRFQNACVNISIYNDNVSCIYTG